MVKRLIKINCNFKLLMTDSEPTGPGSPGTDAPDELSDSLAAIAAMLAVSAAVPA